MERLGPVTRVLAAGMLLGSVGYFRGDSSAYANPEQPAPIVSPDTLGLSRHLGEIVFINATPTIEANAIAAQSGTPIPPSRIEYLMPVGYETPTATPTPTIEEEDDSEQRERQNRGNTNRRLERERKEEKDDKSSRGKNNQNGTRTESENTNNNGNDNDDERVCGQALTTGYNPQTGETRVFSTTCLPDGWVRVDNRKEDPTPPPHRYCPAEFPGHCGTQIPRFTATPTFTATPQRFCPAEFSSRCGTPSTRP